VRAEMLAVMGTMAADLFFNRWDLEVHPIVLFGTHQGASVISLSLFFPSFVRLIDVFNTLLVFSTLLSLL
jgi:hypothetical protein